MPGTILLVEDNPITRKLVRFTLTTQGFEVIEAPDANTARQAFGEHAIALVLQDLCLPDMDGFEFVSVLRKLPGGSEIPILAFSGMLSQADEARVSAAGFDDLITKPIEPSRLLQVIRSYLPSSDDTRVEVLGKGRRLVVADDDPVQRKLVSFRMQKVGFEVRAAEHGKEALALVRELRPDAVVSDVLMPVLDGFGLCMELRQDPLLQSVPVILTTNSYVEPSDRELAKRAGARDLVLRTPELREVFDALRSSLEAGPSSDRGTESLPEVEDEHVRRMMRQLERQVVLNAGVNQRCALLSAEIAVLKGISEALANHTDIDEALRHTLAACFDAGGISLGALYLKEGDALRVLSFGFSPDEGESELLGFFGEPQLLERAMRARRSTLECTDAASAEGLRMLARTGAQSALILPIAHQSEVFGALVMLSRNGDLRQDDRIKFGEAVAGQISQALAVTYTFREQERLQTAAREQSAILRSVLESIGDGVAVVDEKGSFILWNSAAKDYVNMGPHNGPMHPRNDGLGIFDSDTITRLPLERLPLACAMRGEAIDGVELFVRHEGSPNGVWLSATGRPWRDDQGIVRGGVAVFRDVTRDKATQTQLLVSDRMATVGMLAAGVAHEINNPLACVLANLDLAQREFADYEINGTLTNPQELKDMLSDARNASDRVRQIVRDLKIFSRHEDAPSGAVDVQKVLESSLRMAWTEIRHRAQLIREYGDVRLVEGSESRLGQVFLNLIVNAAQAIPEGDVEKNLIRITTSETSDGRVVVSIADTGTGIAAADLANLFRPFYTTKEAGMGTGLGLAISQRIISALSGEIRVESQLGEGTTFHVILRPARSDAPLPEDTAQRSAPAARRGRILVVDDEPMILEIIRRTLAKEHEVVTTSTASAALDRVRAGDSFDIILCDLMMPQMTGMDLHGALYELGPAHADRIIFLTGGAFTPAARAFLDGVSNQRVDKPFDTQHLRALINDRVR